MSYNLTVTVQNKVVIEGDYLSYEALVRALDMMNEYAEHVDLQVLIFTRRDKPTNVLRYLPVSEFRFADRHTTAALIPLDLDEEDDAEDMEQEEEEETDEDDEDDEDDEEDLGGNSCRVTIHIKRN